MTAEEKILNIKSQIQAVERGATNIITCPYCGKQNNEQVEFCCELFGKASIAALERLRVEQARELMDEAADRHARN